MSNFDNYYGEADQETATRPTLPQQGPEVVYMEELELRWRPMSEEEKAKANLLIEQIHHILILEAKRVGKDLEELRKGAAYQSVLASVMCDIIIRAMQTNPNQEPMTQFSQSALGYTLSGTYLVPGGGIFIKKSELARLGLRTQRYGGIDLC